MTKNVQIGEKIQKIQNPKPSSLSFSLSKRDRFTREREALCCSLFARSVGRRGFRHRCFVRSLLFFYSTTRERDIYTRGGDAKNVAKDDDERTISKSKGEQFCAHFNDLKVLNFDENQWTIEVKQRKTGHSEGSFDAYYLFCSEEKRGKTKRFWSLKEVERKLREDAEERRRGRHRQRNNHHHHHHHHHRRSSSTKENNKNNNNNGRVAEEELVV